MSVLQKMYAIDVKKAPKIYRTNNPKHYGKWCIDYFPKSVPTIASFETAKEAVQFLAKQHGEKQCEAWFGPGWANPVVLG